MDDTLEPTVRSPFACLQLRQDLQERLNKDAPRSEVQADPTDPTKFFQQQDTTFQVGLQFHACDAGTHPVLSICVWQDGVTFATILAVLWLVATAWYKLETTKGL